MGIANRKGLILTKPKPKQRGKPASSSTMVSKSKAATTFSMATRLLFGTAGGFHLDPEGDEVAGLDAGAVVPLLRVVVETAGEVADVDVVHGVVDQLNPGCDALPEEVAVPQCW